MYIRAIELTDLRAFRKARLEFLYPGRRLKGDPFADKGRRDLDDPRFDNVNLVLGTNGSGKSTVLDAIALAMQSPIPQSGYVPKALIRRSKGAAVLHAGIRLELVCQPIDNPRRKGKENWDETLECSVKKEGDHEFVVGPEIGDERFKAMYFDRSPAFLLLGYGVFRRIEELSQGEAQQKRQQGRIARFDRVVTLFNDGVALIPMNSWFPTYPRGKRRNEIVALMNKMTPGTVRFDGRVDNSGELLFRYRGLELPFGALSDGYRGHLGWVGDLLYRLEDIVPPNKRLTDLQGVVLIDEIDAHLHPAWQQEIVAALAQALPKIQFIFTTHSPLIAGTLERANINVVTRKGAGAPKVEPPGIEMYGLSADQILRTDLFGLDSTRAPKFTEEMEVVKAEAAMGNRMANLEYMSMATLGKAGKKFEVVVGDVETYNWGEEAVVLENLAVPDWMSGTAQS